MDKQIAVFLLFVIFTTGHSLSCYQCNSSCVNLTETACSSGTTMCESTTMIPQLADLGTNKTFKGCAADCGNGSINFSIVMIFSECCNSDRCNIQDAQDSNTDALNGNTCYYCDESNNCFNVLNCSGSDDLCVTATGTIEGQEMTLKGCASSSICVAVTSIGLAQNISCCSENLCNGAKSVTQSFLFLCFPLIIFILML
ncbi:lymphocyte antigen 6 family member M2 precursor [Danio rerio]|uniref:Lymphocyte antigen 6 family member M2 n=1 Tax=Danio rerio TaxID=7955 RepID=A0A0R4IAR1_DANRE|nr:lymphocyte antigen 6 family member M2 precursor [Danio rerio]|eukprot:XP_002665293.1 urokinase plasminogen activator surface receptor-like [Danio rerio]